MYIYIYTCMWLIVTVYGLDPQIPGRSPVLWDEIWLLHGFFNNGFNEGGIGGDANLPLLDISILAIPGIKSWMASDLTPSGNFLHSYGK